MLTHPHLPVYNNPLSFVATFKREIKRENNEDLLKENEKKR
jgi:hypothetical protein